MSNQANKNAYWKANLRIVAVLLSIWFIAAFCCSIFFVDALNAIKIGEVGLGFWMAQQGSIYVFVVLVLIYALWMDRLDAKFGLRD